MTKKTEYMQMLFKLHSENDKDLIEYLSTKSNKHKVLREALRDKMLKESNTSGIIQVNGKTAKYGRFSEKYPFSSESEQEIILEELIRKYRAEKFSDNSLKVTISIEKDGNRIYYNEIV